NRLKETGKRIRGALVEGRHPQRIANIVQKADALYASAFFQIQGEWKRINEEVFFELPPDPQHLFPGKKTQYVFGWNPEEKSDPLKKAISARLSPAKITKPMLQLLINQPITLTNDQDWELVPPALRALVHIGMKTAPDREKGYVQNAITIRASLSGWRV